MVEKRYQVLKEGILLLNGGEMHVTLKENSFGRQWFASQEQFDKQVESGLIKEIDRLPGE